MLPRVTPLISCSTNTIRPCPLLPEQRKSWNFPCRMMSTAGSMTTSRSSSKENIPRTPWKFRIPARASRSAARGALPAFPEPLAPHEGARHPHLPRLGEDAPALLVQGGTEDRVGGEVLDLRQLRLVVRLPFLERLDREDGKVQIH